MTVGLTNVPFRASQRVLLVKEFVVELVLWEREGFRLSRTRILLADDHAQMLEYVRKFLSAEFEVVSAVSSGQAALETAARLRPDVIILDIMMPNLGGIEVAMRLQESDLGVKTIFLTVEEDRDICLAALETGAMGYVLKSRLGTDLIPAIKQVIAGGRFVSPGCE